MKRSEIYLKVAEKFERRIYDALFICNEIEESTRFRVCVNENNFPEVFLFRKDMERYAWVNAQFNANRKRYVGDSDPRMLNLKTTICLFAHEIAKSNGN